MALFQVLKGILSLYLVVLSASLFGAGSERDAWVIAGTAQLFFFKLLFGPVNEVFRAKFIQLRSGNGVPAALDATLSVSIIFILAAFAVIACSVWGAVPLARFFAPGYSGRPELYFIARMIRLYMPSLVLGELTYLLVSVLNTYGVFYLPELCSLASTIISIVLLQLLAATWGIDTLLIANYSGMAILLLVLLWQLRAKTGTWVPGRFHIRAAWPFIYGALPFYAAYIAGQAASWAERALATFLGVGSTSVLDYARKFIDLPITVVINVAVTVITPLLATYWARQEEHGRFRHELFVFLRMGWLMVAPVVVLFTVCGREVIRFFLLNGNFDASWLDPAATTLSWFGLGLPGVVLYVSAGQALMVQQRSKVYAAWGIVTQLIPLVFNFLFFRHYGLTLFAVSWTLSQYICGMMMMWRTGMVQAGNWQGNGRILLVLAAAAGAGWAVRRLVQQLPDIWIMLIVGATTCIAIFFFLFLFRTEEYRLLKQLASRRKGRTAV